MLKIITTLTLCIAVAAMAAHTYRQPVFNEQVKVAAEEEAYRQRSVIGYVRMDDMRQLYFEEKQP